ncbi:MAG: class I SAM-dependent methyltransferase [Pseudomonadota bacterium]
MSDPETLEAYAGRVDQYLALVKPEPAASLIAFADALPPGGKVLDLGCGPGHAARYLASRGFDTHAWDLSPEMIAAVGDAPSLKARVAGFDDLVSQDDYDGIFASFSLLHAPKSAMPRHMASIGAALKPGGIFHLGMKLGEGEERDSIGRFYAYYTRHELLGFLKEQGLHPVWEREGEEKGLAGKTDPFLLIRAVKHG